MGAWIEIKEYASAYAIAKVAPLVGAWIEIPFCGILSYKEVVAPLVGAWIEIRQYISHHYLLQCRSPRGSVD